ncbi:MAG: solute-binding protein [Leptolinea sp.]|nr:solute-binding protein [Leptolinea sp.]
MKKNALSLIALLAILLSTLTACVPQTAPTPAAEAVPASTSAPAEAAPAANPTEVSSSNSNTEIILATTTSTRDSGLLDTLLPEFEKSSGIKVKMVAVGSGAALTMGQEGNADVLLVHSPAAEEKYMEEGYGKDRVLVMHNDFVVVGPEDDPAGISGAATTADAFKAIADAGSIFVSRADNSGTHSKELAIWKQLSLTPEGDWYLQSGQGMGETLRIASEKACYTLTDRSTYLSLKDTLDLSILYEGEKSLLNIYHVITVNPDKHSNLNYDGAKAFADWIVSAETQKIIATFGTEKFGQPLFFADAENN